MNTTSKSILSVFFVLLVPACGKPTASTSALQAIDSTKDDVQTLSASNSPEQITVHGGSGTTPIDLSKCQIATSGDGYRQYDCTAWLEMKTGTPALHKMLVNTYVDGNGNVSSEYDCHVLTVKTLLLKTAAASPVFAGIGFYSNTSPGMLVAKDRLKLVGTAKLKDGRDVLIHQFVGAAVCWQGDSSSSANARYEFKSFASYTSGSDTYNVWENSNGNHAIGFVYGSWDRSGDLLQ